MEAFIARHGLEKELGGQGQKILDAAGATDLEDLLENVEALEDLKDVESDGFKVLHVKKLFKAILKERENRSKPQLLQRGVSTVPEDTVKEPSSYVAVSDLRQHYEKPAKTEKKPVELPGPIGQGPLFSRSSQPARAEAPEAQAPFDLRQAFGDAPALPAPGQKRAGPQDRSREAAQAANAGLAEQMIRGPVHLPAKTFDRTLEFVWTRQFMKVVKGKREFEESPISKLTEDEFKAEFVAALKTYCGSYEGDLGHWETPEIERWLDYEPNPGKKRSGQVEPHVMICFRHVEDAMGIRDGFRDFQAGGPESKFMTIRGQALLVERPNPNKVARAASEHLSETVSQAPSAAGSVNSHSSVAQTHRNLTLIFRNLPTGVMKNIVMTHVNKYVERVLSADGGLPVATDQVKYAASFSEPRRAPEGAVWLTFSYPLEGQRINALGKKFDDGKPYTLVAFMEQYRKSGQPEKTDDQLQAMWSKCEDAVQAAEKALGKGRPLGIANFFMNRVRAIDKKKRDAVMDKQKNNQDISAEERQKYIDDTRSTWTECTIGSKTLSVEFMSMRR